ncbi:MULTISPECIES: amino acid kinase family protein [unclassified Schlesneria]|uniref:amino acid kinase family protein n=1 Tax=unclassified Schlesneria TaxID=2762017 RepID=UPI002F083C0E
MTVILKLGGSLLTLPGLAERLLAVLSQRPGDRCLILIGGGATTDVVRNWSKTHHLTQEVAHWLAISSLDLNRKLLEALLPWTTVASRAAADQHWKQGADPLLLDFHQFVREEEPISGLPLPHHWDVTSDSLAAWTARLWPAEELILLKSAGIPDGVTLQAAARDELVDSYFPHFASGIEQISWCNLRASELKIQPWRILD